MLSSEPPKQYAGKILKRPSADPCSYLVQPASIQADLMPWVTGIQTVEECGGDARKKRPRTTLSVNARGIARSTYWPNRSGSHYIKRGIDRAVSRMNVARPTAAGAFDIRPIRAANELAAEWLKEILPSVNELDHLQRRFEEQSGFFESSGRQNRDGQEESEQDDEIYGDEEHRLLRARRAFCWPRLSSSRSDRLQATRADWCEGAYLVTAGRT